MFIAPSQNGEYLDTLLHSAKVVTLPIRDQSLVPHPSSMLVHTLFMWGSVNEPSKNYLFPRPRVPILFVCLPTLYHVEWTAEDLQIAVSIYALLVACLRATLSIHPRSPGIKNILGLSPCCGSLKDTISLIQCVL
jgi:hypothetical protein